MCSFLTMVLLLLNHNDSSAMLPMRGMTLILGFASIWLIILMIQLRRIEATNDHLVIKSGNSRKKVDYQDIQWITQHVLINPVLISLKYYESETGTTKKILILPSMTSEFFKFNYFGEVEMTTFIRAQIKARNSGYLEKEEPSRWLAALLIFATGVPLALVNVFYLNPFHH